VLPLIHPELCRVSPLPAASTTTCRAPGWAGRWTCARARAPCHWTVNLDPRVVLYLGLFPDLLISLHPDYVMTHRFTSLAPALTGIECSWYFVDDGVDPSYAVDFWDLTNRQDWGACESVQRGVVLAAFRSRSVRAERGRRAPVGDDGRTGLSGDPTVVRGRPLLTLGPCPRVLSGYSSAAT
jgi:glycine betaine catabolism A